MSCVFFNQTTKSCQNSLIPKWQQQNSLPTIMLHTWIMPFVNWCAKLESAMQLSSNVSQDTDLSPCSNKWNYSRLLLVSSDWRSSMQSSISISSTCSGCIGSSRPQKCYPCIQSFWQKNLLLSWKFWHSLPSIIYRLLLHMSSIQKELVNLSHLVLQASAGHRTHTGYQHPAVSWSGWRCAGLHDAWDAPGGLISKMINDVC